MRSTRLLLILCILSALLVLGGCARKKKVTTAPDAIAETTESRPAPTGAMDSPGPAAAPASDSDPLAGDLDSVNEYLRRQGLLGDAYFLYDEADLSAETREQLARNATFLNQYPQFRVTVEGHCDERGTSEYNLALGERRAASVRDYLVSLGVPSNRLSTITYGKERPVCADEDESCWKLNRRAHHVVTGRSGG
jgi:peptidoglycan-associated lipoprotein